MSAAVWTWVPALAVAALAWRLARPLPSLARVALAVAPAAGLILVSFDTARDMEALAGAAGAPPRDRKGGFASRQACEPCHSAETASYHHTFHRTMTQAAGADAVLAPFAGERLEDRGRAFVLDRRGASYQAHEVTASGSPISSREIVMTTGSHHQQAYWYRDARGVLRQLPWVWLVQDGRWIPNADSFLVDPTVADRAGTGRWDGNCYRCHSTGWAHQRDQSANWVTVADHSISCEACHGPAAEHVRANRSPLRRWWFALSGQSDPTIVHPGKLPSDRASAVCAQCHSESFPKPGADQGPFIAGRTHDEHFMARAPLNLYKVTAERGIVRPHVAGAFWPDGTARVAGREYTAMMMSRCHTEGSMQCLSCHSMHDAPRDKQVHVRRSGDAGCLQCHADIGRDIPAHTHHAPGSSGSECLNCHMPRVTYGLLGARRNHRVDSPRVLAGSNARPVACNLCHLDRSLAWSAQFLQRWYGVPHPALPDEHREVAAAVLWALRGDAAQRAITAWHLGWPPARAVSGDDWLAPVLAHLLDDPYAAVRYIAGRSLFGRGRDGERGYDFVASPEARRAAARRVLDEWRARPGRVARPSVLIGAGGALDDERFASLAADRDDSPLGISE